MAQVGGALVAVLLLAMTWSSFAHKISTKYKLKEAETIGESQGVELQKGYLEIKRGAILKMPPRIDNGNSLKAMTTVTVLLLFGGAIYLLYISHSTSTAAE
eukprot:13396-Heterococcus_DN1.PRE.2